MNTYQRLADLIAFQSWQYLIEHWLLTELFVRETLLQIATVLAALAVALLLSLRLVSSVTCWLATHRVNRLAAVLANHIVSAATAPALALIVVGVAILAAGAVGVAFPLLPDIALIMTAWIAIRAVAGLMRSTFWAGVFTVSALVLTSLGVLGLLEPTIVWLDQLVIGVGAVRLSALDILRGVVQAAALLWLALLASHFLEDQVRRADGMAPSLRVLTGKLLRFTFVALAIILALSSVGVDLTAFALFTGALGVALGFGMQKSVSNLISGLLLLVDRSIKPGDVLEMTDPSNRSVQLFGWVTSLNARYVSLTTRDGTEWLIPNDELITRRVVNWSYTHNRVRLLTPIAVSFECDVKLAIKIAVDAAMATDRVLADPPPVCRLMGFADSAVNLEMRFWVNDPANGIINVRSDVLLAVWEGFRANGIRTPLGHRDLYIKQGSALSVHLKDVAPRQAQTETDRVDDLRAPSE